MEIRKISKKDKDGKRLFVEITKKLKNGNNLKAGDEVMILSRNTRLTEDELMKHIGKHLKYYLLDVHGNLIRYDGILQENKMNYTYNKKKHGEMDKDFIDYHIEELSSKFVLLDKPYSKEEDEQVLERFDELFNVIDFEVSEPNNIDFNTVLCKCKRNISRKDKYCKFCGKMNMKYTKES